MQIKSGRDSKRCQDIASKPTTLSRHHARQTVQIEQKRNVGILEHQHIFYAKQTTDVWGKKKQFQIVLQSNDTTICSEQFLVGSHALAFTALLTRRKNAWVITCIFHFWMQKSGRVQQRCHDSASKPTAISSQHACQTVPIKQEWNTYILAHHSENAASKDIRLDNGPTCQLMSGRLPLRDATPQKLQCNKAARN